MAPPSKPAEQRRRRNVQTPAAVVRLPVEGRKGRAPKFPLQGESEGESVLWRELWKTPQAVMWERSGPGTVRLVARYVRLLLPVESPEFGGGDEKGYSQAQLLGEVRQLEDRLGLSPKAMQALKWVVDDDADEPVAPSVPSRRRDLKIVG
jgi:hypothetical protein